MYTWQIVKRNASSMNFFYLQMITPSKVEGKLIQGSNT